MDYLLKGSETGIDAAYQIQDSKKIPIIFLTGNRQLLDSLQIKNLQDYKIISKPPVEFELINEINKFVK